MKVKQVRLLILVLLVGLFSSCTMQKKMPYYTEPALIINLKKGMSVSQVEATLQAPPFDVYMVNKTGGSIFTYKYRLKKRAMNYSDELNSANSQTAGTVTYDEASTLYVYYENGQLASYISDMGRKDGKQLLLSGNIIQLVNKDQLVDIEQRRTLTYEGQIAVLNGFETVEMPVQEKIETAEKQSLNTPSKALPRSSEFNVKPTETEVWQASVNSNYSPLYHAEFFNALPTGREGYHAKSIADKDLAYPGQHLSVISAYGSVLTLGLVRAITPNKNKRYALYNGEVTRRALIIKYDKLQNKGKLSAEKAKQFDSSMQLWETKILNKYAILESRNQRFDKK